MKIKNLAAIAAAMGVSLMLGGCAVADGAGSGDNDNSVGGLPPAVESPPSQDIPDVPSVEIPEKQKVPYISVERDGVNIRSGAGTDYKVLGAAEQATLYAYLGEQGDWYETRYKNGTAYISKKFCVLVDMEANEEDRVEAVIAEGTKHLGTKYVYGAVRYHDGRGNKLKNFTTSAFDCSSLMQYMFYQGAGIYLNMTTRTQISQGKAVTDDLKRGDLMFFTNESRKNNTGIERVGHVALYLGDNYILHTASDYAKIEQISQTRWSYYLSARRMV